MEELIYGGVDNVMYGTLIKKKSLIFTNKYEIMLYGMDNDNIDCRKVPLGKLIIDITGEQLDDG